MQDVCGATASEFEVLELWSDSSIKLSRHLIISTRALRS